MILSGDQHLPIIQLERYYTITFIGAKITDIQYNQTLFDLVLYYSFKSFFKNTHQV